MSNCSLKRAPFTLCTQCDHLIKRFYHRAQTQGGRAKALSSLILACSASITPEYFLDVIYNKNLKKFNIFFPSPCTNRNHCLSFDKSFHLSFCPCLSPLGPTLTLPTICRTPAGAATRPQPVVSTMADMTASLRKHLCAWLRGGGKEKSFSEQEDALFGAVFE